MLTLGKLSEGPSLRVNFAWNLLGETTFSLAQWLLIVLLARLESPQLVGEFAFALAVTAPVYLLVGLNLRVVQATDARRLWLLEDYLRLRHVLNGMAFTICVAVSFVADLDSYGVLVVAAVAAAKATEALSQTYYGFFQRHERLDLVARSLLLRASIATCLFVSSLWLLPGLLPAVMALWCAWLMVALAHDRRIGSRMRAAERVGAEETGQRTWASLLVLARVALPLGVSAGVSSLAINIPRYLLVGVQGAAALGVYAALAYLAQVVVLFTGAMGNAVVPRLAKYVRDGDTHAFVRLVGQLTALGVAICGCLLAVLSVAGKPLIGAVLGDAYVNQPLLLTLILGAGLSTVQRSLGRGLQAAHRFGAFLAVDVVTLVLVAITCPWLLARYGAEGAAWSMNAAFAVAVTMTVLLLAQTVRRMRSEVGQEAWSAD